MGFEICFVLANLQISGELSAASPERLSMASPSVGGGKRVHNLTYSADLNQSRISLSPLLLCIFSFVIFINYFISI